jgi:hypothetical protein
VPHNATRQANLPPTDFTLIALAPWINEECTKAYLGAARNDPTRAFLFYLPDNGTGQPPPVHSPVWKLQDGGAWKWETPYPVYAVASDAGTELMHQLSLYSGNMTEVPYGHEISELPGGDPRDYVRVYAQIDTFNNSSIPSFWQFILIIAAFLAIMVAMTSASMHFIQQSRRRSLRRRVASGEVNLEGLGIKRITVPQEAIDSLPVFVYGSERKSSSPISMRKRSLHNTIVERHDSTDSSSMIKDIPASQDDMAAKAPNPSNAEDDANSAPPRGYLPNSQPTCAICLDDFEPRTTPIKELPCGHIFHPECIDTFLGNNSSLCPMCKKSVLPIGYCPARITNTMVRRERNIRALRSRVGAPHNGNNDNPPASISQNITTIIKGILSPPRETSNDVLLEPQLVVMTSAIPAEIGPHVSVLGHEVLEAASPRPTRQEIAERRIQELISRQTFVEEIETVNTGHRPKCTFDSKSLKPRTNRSSGRRRLSKVFPGFS